MLHPVHAHFVFDMSSYVEVRAGLRGAKQNEARFTVLREISLRVTRIKLAGLYQLPCTAQTTTLMTDGREKHPCCLCRIPKMLISTSR
jgi:hypothetical protein